jgi:hypothetical protein
MANNFDDAFIDVTAVNSGAVLWCSTELICGMVSEKLTQPRINRTLTNEDARAITENITGFFKVLIELSRNATPDLSHKFTESANSKISGVCYD